MAFFIVAMRVNPLILLYKAVKSSHLSFKIDIELKYITRIACRSRDGRNTVVVWFLN